MMRRKRLVLSVAVGILAGWVLAGCQVTETPRAATLIVLSEVCNTYSSALRVLTPLRATGRLTEDEVAQVDEANQVADEVCLPGSTVPEDPLEAISTINNKVVELLLIRERKGV